MGQRHATARTRGGNEIIRYMDERTVMRKKVGNEDGVGVADRHGPKDMPNCRYRSSADPTWGMCQDED
jgi:hypothetical protein